jgi:hypothetical protein
VAGRWLDNYWRDLTTHLTTCLLHQHYKCHYHTYIYVDTLILQWATHQKSAKIHDQVLIVLGWLCLQLHMQSVPITTKVVSSNPAHGEVCLIQHYVIKFVSDLWQVGGFLCILWYPLPIQMSATIQLKCMAPHN